VSRRFDTCFGPQLPEAVGGRVQRSEAVFDRAVCGRRSLGVNEPPAHAPPARGMGGRPRPAVRSKRVLALSDLASHITVHIIVGLIALFVLGFLLWRWLPSLARREASIARWLLALGLAVVVVGQLLEVIGASGYDGDDRVSGLATVHDVGVPLTPVGMVFAFLGAVGSVAALLLAHSRPDSRRWVIGGMVLAGVGATVFIVGGIVFGY
jgi:hypothetical protein